MPADAANARTGDADESQLSIDDLCFFTVNRRIALQWLDEQGKIKLKRAISQKHGQQFLCALRILCGK
jgi:hypothetical protein